MFLCVCVCVFDSRNFMHKLTVKVSKGMRKLTG